MVELFVTRNGDWLARVDMKFLMGSMSGSMIFGFIRPLDTRAELKESSTRFSESPLTQNTVTFNDLITTTNDEFLQGNNS